MRVEMALFLLCWLVSAVPAAAEPQRPAIFIPGILGSRLADENGKILWGELDSYGNFRKLALPRDDDAIQLKSKGVIESIPIVWPFKIKQYADLLDALEVAGYERDKNLFVFHYDWRRSNFKSAALLDEFIRDTPELRAGSFDIIAHSMGGLVAVILFKEHEAGSRINKLVTFGTPFFGSLNALDTYLNGFSGVAGFFSELGITEDEVLRVMFSFESGYELLPTYPECCVLGPRGDPARVPIDITRADFWSNAWLPASFSTPQDKEFVRLGLERRRRLSEIVDHARATLLDHSADHFTELRLFAGDKFATRARMYFHRDGSPQTTQWKGGDGTVWLWSASCFEPDEARVSFRQHERLFDDEHARAELLRQLVPSDELEPFAAQAEGVKVPSTTDTLVPVDLVTLETRPPVSPLGKSVEFVLELRGKDVVTSAESFDFSICPKRLGGAREQTCVPMQEEARSEDRRRFTVGYAPPAAGSYSIELKPLSIEDYFAVATAE